MFWHTNNIFFFISKARCNVFWPRCWAGIYWTVHNLFPRWDEWVWTISRPGARFYHPLALGSLMLSPDSIFFSTALIWATAGTMTEIYYSAQNLMWNFPRFFFQRRVLDLGSGCGATSIAAAMWVDWEIYISIHHLFKETVARQFWSEFFSSLSLLVHTE